jgi:hypothetical protein
MLRHTRRRRGIMRPMGHVDVGELIAIAAVEVFQMVLRRMLAVLSSDYGQRSQVLDGPRKARVAIRARIYSLS